MDHFLCMRQVGEIPEVIYQGLSTKEMMLTKTNECSSFECFLMFQKNIDVNINYHSSHLHSNYFDLWLFKSLVFAQE